MALILENDEILSIEYRINSSIMLLIIRIAHRAVVSGNFDYFIHAPRTLHNINPPTRNISKASTRPWDSNQTVFVTIYSFATVATR